MQLEEPPPSISHLEEWALRRMAPGPGNWIQPSDLHQLKCYGCPFQFQNLSHTSLASKLRVCTFEPQLVLQNMHSDLLFAFANLRFKRSKWDSWYNQSYVLNLVHARLQADSLDITERSIRDIFAKTSRQNQQASSAETLFRRRFQALVSDQLSARAGYSSEGVLRRKLARWRIAGVPEGTLTRRAVRILHRAFALVPARVAFVLFRSWFNGWCTARRFQNRSALCRFGCESGSAAGCHDSIEHYAHCKAVRAFAADILHLPHQVVGSLQGFLCLSAGLDDDTLTLQLLLLYAVYTATNVLRFAQPCAPIGSVKELLLQFVHQGARNSSNAQHVVHRAMFQRARQRARRGAGQ